MPREHFKSHRMREKIHKAAGNVMAKEKDAPKKIISVENPFIEGASRRINVFDVFDDLQRLSVILEPSPKEEGQEQTYVMHIIKWNCNAIQAHNLAVEAVYQTRRQEQESIAEVVRSNEIGSNGVHDKE